MFLNLSSVKVYAYTGDGATVFPLIWHNEPSIYIRQFGNYSNVLYNGNGGLVTNQNAYSFSNNKLTNVGTIDFVKFNSQLDFNFAPSVYDYYVVLTLNSIVSNSSDFYYDLNSVIFNYVDNLNQYGNIYLQNLSVYTHSDTDSMGLTVIGQLPASTNTDLYGLSLTTNSPANVGSNLRLEGFIVAFAKGSDVGVNQIVTAINNQTSSLSGAIGSAADQVTDKIDEVLTPEGENNLGEYVDQITDQIDENLGALGFAHDTVENFIGLFNEEPPAPVISVPPLKMKINGVEHQFFNGYEYDIRTLEAGPLNFLIQAVRFACSCILWWAFLSYCFDEFDELFRGS